MSTFKQVLLSLNPNEQQENTLKELRNCEKKTLSGILRYLERNAASSSRVSHGRVAVNKLPTRQPLKCRVAESELNKVVTRPSVSSVHG